MIAGLEPYPQRKDPGVAWLGEGSTHAFLCREVRHHHAPDARHLPGSVKTIYEISSTRYFYQPKPLRTLVNIRADIVGAGDRSPAEGDCWGAA
jgi:hypothetical protein